MHLWPNAYGLWVVFRLPLHQRMRRDMPGLESKKGTREKEYEHHTGCEDKERQNYYRRKKSNKKERTKTQEARFALPEA